MDQGEVLLASASLRALFFESPPDVPMLRQLLGDDISKVRIEAIESDFTMFLLAVSPQSGWIHGGDFFFELLNNPILHQEHPFDVPKEALFHLPRNETTESMWKKHQAWLTTIEAGDRVHSHFHFDSAGGVTAMASICRRAVGFDKWGDLRIGYAKDIPITRKNVVKHVANKVGGIHYDKSRLPHRKDDVDSFKALTEVFDWNEQSAMHAGLVATAVCCAELIRVPILLEIYRGLASFLAARQRRLEGEDRSSRQARLRNWSDCS
jgi:hypothetical protein